MARAGAKASAKNTPPGQPSLPAATSDEMTLAELAEGILARRIRPRTAQVRSLAQAVLDAEEKRARRKAKAEEKKKAGGKKRKLAKIPRQKKR